MQNGESGEMYFIHSVLNCCFFCSGPWSSYLTDLLSLGAVGARIDGRSSYSQPGPAVSCIRTQVFTVASPALLTIERTGYPKYKNENKKLVLFVSLKLCYAEKIKDLSGYSTFLRYWVHSFEHRVHCFVGMGCLV